MIIHVANVTIDSSSGMGRIALEWKKAFESRGHQFLHVNEHHSGQAIHPLLLGRRIRNHIIKMGWKPSLILAHEPLAGWLKFDGIPLVSFSHGVEERAWKVLHHHSFQQVSAKARLVPTPLRFLSNNKGFTNASLCLLSNQADVNYLKKQKSINNNVQVFRNGYYPYPNEVRAHSNTIFLFNASWIPRKGIKLMVNSFNKLLVSNPIAGLIIAGTSLSSESILNHFDANCRSQIKVYPNFDASTESNLYNEANIFVMPSYFEGQSLALTQAMAMGLCPVAANNSGQIDIIQHNVNGLLFETGNSDDFLKMLQWCMLKPDAVQKLGAKAKQTVCHLNWQYCANQVVEYCEKLL